MFAKKIIICSEGNIADYFCIGQNCQESPFVCDQLCACKSKHQKLCQLKNIPKLTNQVESLLKRNYSKTLKGEGIQISGRVAKQTVSAPRNCRFAFTICEVKPQVSIQFKVKTLKGCVGVGILHKPSIIKNLYQFLPDASYINHGSYMLLSNGYKYSHTDKSENFQQIPKISLEEGEKVKLEYNEGKLTISQRMYEGTISIPQDLSDLWYGIYLYEQGDQMQVLIKE